MKRKHEVDLFFFHPPSKDKCRIVHAAEETFKLISLTSLDVWPETANLTMLRVATLGTGGYLGNVVRVGGLGNISFSQ